MEDAYSRPLSLVMGRTGRRIKPRLPHISTFHCATDSHIVSPSTPAWRATQSMQQAGTSSSHSSQFHSGEHATVPENPPHTSVFRAFDPPQHSHSHWRRPGLPDEDATSPQVEASIGPVRTTRSHSARYEPISSSTGHYEVRPTYSSYYEMISNLFDIASLAKSQSVPLNMALKQAHQPTLPAIFMAPGLRTLMLT